MRSRRLALLCATAAAAATGALTAPSGSQAERAACGAEYSYAGWQARDTSAGVAAVLTTLEEPSVRNGHVAAWVGVGGVGAGPDGADEWLQVGVSAFSAPGSSSIYYEVTQPHRPPRYVQVASSVPVGEPHRVAILEMAHRPSWWRVWVDGQPVSQPIELVQSHAAWSPQAVAESWNAGTGGCNSYSFRFDRLLRAGGPGGDWRPFQEHVPLADRGYRVLSSGAAAFVATSD